MDGKIQRIVKPNYKKIYEDLIKYKYPEKIEACRSFFEKSELNFIDVININSIISKTANTKSGNQKYRAYDKSAIIHILEYQKKNKLTNIQTSIHFKISRNTIGKWKKIFVL